MSGNERSTRHRTRGIILSLTVFIALSEATLGVEAAERGMDYTDATHGHNPATPCPLILQDKTVLSLARAVDLALCNNAKIRASWAVIREQAAIVGEAKAAYWPTVNATAAELHDRTTYPGSSVPSTARTGDELYGAADWRLFDFGGRGANRRAAQAQLEAAIASRDATIQKILGDTVQGYFDAVTARGFLHDKINDEAAARAIEASANRRASLGQAGQGDILQSATALARVTLSVHRAQAAYDKAVAGLVYLLGLPAESQVQLSEELEEVRPVSEENLTTWLTEAEREHPAITAARANLAAANEHVKVVRSAGLPSLDLTANYYQNGFPNQGLNSINSHVTTFGIYVTVPLFDGWATHHRIDEARAIVTVREAELEDTEQATLLGVINAHADAESALQNLRASEDLLRAAQQSFSSSQRRYSNGVGDIVELLSTQSAQADAEEERVRCVAEWHAARLMLLASAGRLVKEAIQ
jgi:outer membrane protein